MSQRTQLSPLALKKFIEVARIENKYTLSVLQQQEHIVPKMILIGEDFAKKYATKLKLIGLEKDAQIIGQYISRSIFSSSFGDYFDLRTEHKNITKISIQGTTKRLYFDINMFTILNGAFCDRAKLKDFIVRRYPHCSRLYFLIMNDQIMVRRIQY